MRKKMMSDADKGKAVEELVAFLKTQGWDEEKAKSFLQDKVGIRSLHIPGRLLLDTLKEVCQEGVPTGTVVISFLVPEGRWGAFKDRAQAAIAKHGGFVFSPGEKAALSGQKLDSIN